MIHCIEMWMYAICKIVLRGAFSWENGIFGHKINQLNEDNKGQNNLVEIVNLLFARY